MQIKDNTDNLIFETIYNNYIANNTQCDKNLLFESYNLYDGIYDDVSEITKTIVEMIQNGIFNTEYNKIYEGKSLKINSIKIKLLIDNSDFNGSSNISNRCLSIELSLGVMLRHLDYGNIYDIISRWVENIIIHELTHAKNDSEITIKNNEESYPFWYEIAIDAINGEHKMNGLAHVFFYSLYLSYFSEVQAISSQITSEVNSKIKHDEAWDRLTRKEKIEKIKDLVSSSEYYYSYVILKQWKLPLLKNMNRIEKENIINRFKQYGVNISEPDLKKYIKQIEYGCDRAFAKIRRGMNGIFINNNLV